LQFFSKIVTYCNVAFLLSAVLRLLQFGTNVKANSNAVQQTNFVVSTILILGVFAIFLNFVFIIALIIQLVRKKEINISKILLIGNVLLFPVQIWYYFFSKI
jgi:hypothetical protein